MRFRVVFFSLIFLSALQVHAQTTQPELPSFTITNFNVTGDNPLTSKQTASVLQDYLGPHIGLEGLQAAADALEQELRKRGFGFHRVILPMQTLSVNIVELQVIEYKLGDINIADNKFYNEENILNSLRSLEKEQSVNLRKLSRDLQFANRHASRKLQVNFRDSEKVQAVDAHVKVEERNPSGYFAVLQNSGTEETGEYRLSLGYRYSNLFNKDHDASLIYTTSPDESGAISQYALNYRVPFYASSSALNVSYSDSNADSGIVEDLFDVSGKGSVFALAYQYHFLNAGNYKHSIGVSYEDKLFEDDTLFLGDDQNGVDPRITADPSTLADPCLAIETKVRTNPFSVNYRGDINGNNSAFGFSLNFISNQATGSNSDDLSYSCTRADALPDWSMVRYSLLYDVRIADSWLVSLNYSAQSTSDSLVPGEQFGLGGAHSIRGYEERSMLGDSGWQSKLEVYMPPFMNQTMSVLFFYDLGYTKLEQVTIDTGVPSEFEPAGAGLGWRWSWNKQLTVSTDLAVALEPIGDVEDGDSSLHLSAFYRF